MARDKKRKMPEPDVTPPERPSALESAYDATLGVPHEVAAEINAAAFHAVSGACPVCGSAWDGKCCKVDGYRGEP